MLLRGRNLLGVLIIGGMTAGCVEDFGTSISGRWGPNPALQATNVGAVAQNQNLVLTYLAQASGRAVITREGMFVQGTPEDWLEIAQFGFNVGRQDCEVYLANLFRMNREKARNDNLLTAVSTAAALIVTATTTAQKPLSILAAAFGLSIAANDAIFQSYLFSQAPGLVAKKVADLQEEFRNKITVAEVYSPSSAYNAIQTYYHICLPHSIEGVLLQKIADAGPVTPGRTNVDVVVPAAAMLAPAQAKRFRQGSAQTGRGIRSPELR
jgi:hypothetical protein